jgi:hypothetical protein
MRSSARAGLAGALLGAMLLAETFSPIAFFGLVCVAFGIWLAR